MSQSNWTKREHTQGNSFTAWVNRPKGTIIRLEALLAILLYKGTDGHVPTRNS